MIKKILSFVVFAGLLLGADSALAVDVPFLIYGAPRSGRDSGLVFLGCIGCGVNNTNSVANEFGPYSNGLYLKSIYNPLGPWGDYLSNSSACNPMATKPPVVVDEKGNFQGYLTVNEQFQGRALDPTILGACK
jgi:hypothetical protein